MQWILPFPIFLVTVRRKKKSKKRPQFKFFIVLSLDVMDESGDHVGDYDHDVYKERLDSSGRAIVKAKSEGKKIEKKRGR